ncbi:hypothetical protein CROQUDRAFT_111734 [Cronartium quercuum f. sp. fusiforme G11]|uniref:Uncharacterized protein n=1 Tax=Cronartium quercuum f. sp. fusiforme G11 TaxID=708437 RepID=A0A9P6N5S4_9BASI|nr:hypothetical protein CROQUDRAFT_111734 [Cronartium quercuum f. sp. fusiforme G11]
MQVSVVTALMPLVISRKADALYRLRKRLAAQVCPSPESIAVAKLASQCVQATPPLDHFICSGANPTGVCGVLSGGEVNSGSSAILVSSNYSCDGLHQIQASCCGSVYPIPPFLAFHCSAVTPK